MNSFDRVRLVTKEEIIQMGLQYLDGVGITTICKVCISNGGSCCLLCNFLEDGVGCQKRNTSCTSWLCGFLRFIFFEIGILDEWEQFWEQIPGMSFRMDYTPDVVPIEKSLEAPKIQFIGQAFAKDLTSMINENMSCEVIDLNDKLDRYVSWFSITNDKKIIQEDRKELKDLTDKLHSFKLAIHDYKNC